MHLHAHSSIAEIPQNEWNALTEPDTPFADHEHFLALERHACVGAQSGWIPLYLAVRKNTEPNSALLGVIFLFFKNNSYGEFIFDWSWAQAYQRHGLSYYPKWVSAIPFTPSTGKRMLVDAHLPFEEQQQIESTLLEAALNLIKSTKATGLHILFHRIKEEHLPLKADGLLRHSFQYHWHNRGYKSFDDFLVALTSKRRRQIALERRQLSKVEGIEIFTREKHQLTQLLADEMFSFYKNTNEKNCSYVCLTQGFFREVFETMSDRTVVFEARKMGKTIAAAINFCKGDKMFGRYWGSHVDVRNLHFELCYYRAIEHCIERGYSLYEAGAQGEHKFPRGFLPVKTYSSHWIAHPTFREAIADFVEQEKKELNALMESYDEHNPYK
jgi:uncharacterized protein